MKWWKQEETFYCGRGCKQMLWFQPRLQYVILSGGSFREMDTWVFSLETKTSCWATCFSQPTLVKPNLPSNPSAIFWCRVEVFFCKSSKQNREDAYTIPEIGRWRSAGHGRPSKASSQRTLRPESPRYPELSGLAKPRLLPFAFFTVWYCNPYL